MKIPALILVTALSLFGENMTRDKLFKMSDMVVTAKIEVIEDGNRSKEITIKHDDKETKFLKGDDKIYYKNYSMIIYDYNGSNKIDFERFYKEKKPMTFYLKSHSMSDPKYPTSFTLVDPIYGLQEPKHTPQ
jgi:hypothetical protein